MNIRFKGNIVTGLLAAMFKGLGGEIKALAAKLKNST